MDAVLLRMLVDWFSVGFLDLQRISWNSPAAYLEQVRDCSTALWVVAYFEQVRAMLSMHTAPRLLSRISNSSLKGENTKRLCKSEGLLNQPTVGGLFGHGCLEASGRGSGLSIHTHTVSCLAGVGAVGVPRGGGACDQGLERPQAPRGRGPTCLCFLPQVSFFLY
jgi:hypothetical protein